MDIRAVGRVIRGRDFEMVVDLSDMVVKNEPGDPVVPFELLDVPGRGLQEPLDLRESRCISVACHRIGNVHQDRQQGGKRLHPANAQGRLENQAHGHREGAGSQEHDSRAHAGRLSGIERTPGPYEAGDDRRRQQDQRHMAQPSRGDDLPLVY